jgi:hypothetical protein
MEPQRAYNRTIVKKKIVKKEFEVLSMFPTYVGRYIFTVAISENNEPKKKNYLCTRSRRWDGWL